MFVDCQGKSLDVGDWVELIDGQHVQIVSFHGDRFLSNSDKTHFCSEVSLRKKRPGRPKTASALTAAQRVHAQRLRDLNATPHYMTLSGLTRALSTSITSGDKERASLLLDELKKRAGL